MLKLQQTMDPDIKFAKNGDHWRFFDCSTGEPRSVGPIYPTKTLLLADMHRYLTEHWGL